MQLKSLLEKHFPEVQVDYAIVGGRYRKMGLKPWSVRRPIVTFSSNVGNVVNSIQSANREIRHQAEGTHHLIAIAKK